MTVRRPTKLTERFSIRTSLSCSHSADSTSIQIECNSGIALANTHDTATTKGGDARLRRCRPARRTGEQDLPIPIEKSRLRRPPKKEVESRQEKWKIRNLRNEMLLQPPLCDKSTSSPLLLVNSIKLGLSCTHARMNDAIPSYTYTSSTSIGLPMAQSFRRAKPD